MHDVKKMGLFQKKKSVGERDIRIEMCFLFKQLVKFIKLTLNPAGTPHFDRKESESIQNNIQSFFSYSLQNLVKTLFRFIFWATPFSWILFHTPVDRSQSIKLSFRQWLLLIFCFTVSDILSKKLFEGTHDLILFELLYHKKRWCRLYFLLILLLKSLKLTFLFLGWSCWIKFFLYISFEFPLEKFWWNFKDLILQINIMRLLFKFYW